MKVKVYSMEEVRKTEIVEHVISIRNPFYEGTIFGDSEAISKLDQRLEKEGFQSKLILQFDDVTNGDFGIMFAWDQAKQVLSFLNGKEHSNIAIHCFAGRSRSVAIGRFLKDFYNAEVEYVTCGHDRDYNVIVYNMLKRTYLGMEYA